MSCGKPHETNCSDVLAEVWLFLDNECDQRQRKLLETHLDECQPCLEQYGLQEHLKALLARKCGGDQAPDALRERLRASIRKTVMEQVGFSADDPRLRHSGCGVPREARTDHGRPAVEARDEPA